MSVVEYGENAGMDEASIREHEEVTKVKNVNKLELGRHMIDTWYFSPIPKDYYPDGPIDVLYFCEFSLNFYRFKEELTRHYMKCHTRYPPGRLRGESFGDVEAVLLLCAIGLA